MPDESNGVRMEAVYLAAQREYSPRTFEGPVTIFQALRGGRSSSRPARASDVTRT